MLADFYDLGEWEYEDLNTAFPGLPSETREPAWHHAHAMAYNHDRSKARYADAGTAVPWHQDATSLRWMACWTSVHPTDFARCEDGTGQLYTQAGHLYLFRNDLFWHRFPPIVNTEEKSERYFARWYFYHDGLTDAEIEKRMLTYLKGKKYTALRFRDQVSAA